MRTKAALRPAPIAPQLIRINDSYLAVPLTTADRLERIQALAQRIDGYVQFMSALSGLSGTSTEAKDKAVTGFYECMVALEKQLDRIQNKLRLE
jgi:hypothetical protein